MKNRGRTEIVSHYTGVCKWRSNQDKNNVHAFLSYSQLNEYLSILIENNLLEYLYGTNKFKTTDKGLFFLKIHNEIGEFNKSFSQLI